MTIGTAPLLQIEQRPYVEFYYHPVKDASKTLEEGKVVYKDVEFVRIQPIGDPRLVVEKEVTDEIRGKYEPEYKAWKDGVQAPVQGTDLRNWPVITPAELKNCHLKNIRSVEQLAAINETAIENLGPGARALKDKAVQYLRAAESNGKLAGQMQDLMTKIESLEESNKDKQKAIDSLKAELDGNKKSGKGKNK